MHQNSNDDGNEVNIKKLQYGKVFDGSRCLNLCEVRLILGAQLRSGGYQSSVGQNIITQAHSYATTYAKIKVRQAVLDLRSVLDKQEDLTEFETASLVNLFPKTTEEAKSLLPSLNRLKDSRLNQILEELESYRIFLS